METAANNNKQEKAVNLEDFKLGMVNAMGDILTKELSGQIGQMSMPEIMGWVAENCTEEKLKQYRNLVTNKILGLQADGRPSKYFNQALSIDNVQDLFEQTLTTYASAIRNQIKNKTNAARNTAI